MIRHPFSFAGGIAGIILHANLFQDATNAWVIGIAISFLTLSVAVLWSSIEPTRGRE